MIKGLFLNEKFILTLIFINSVVLFFGGYMPADHSSHTLFIIDHVITALFIFEMIIKNREYGIKVYFKSGWNIFDFILVVLSIPSLVTFLFQLEFVDFSFLLVFRIMRVFKAFRFFKFIPNVGQLVNGIQRALKASVFVFIGFGIYIFIIGILSLYLFQGSNSEYFKDPMVSLYSIFKIFTVEGWFEIPEEVTEGYSQTASFFTYLYFIFVVLTGGIFGLSLVNSIFVDSMVSDNSDELEKKIDKLDTKISELITRINDDKTPRKS
ncbi:ion transporter [Prolixibacteraceae bacterium Z1-6]|uniref:Ion transporter n=1 Tax=Draconibacterium aestuarii TaxID=2998507 RepID=A0A9X3FBT2_9BACT|nr:ion transporter [Prolixibacteraceae bacterium Z1-6]